MALPILVAAGHSSWLAPPRTAPRRRARAPACCALDAGALGWLTACGGAWSDVEVRVEDGLRGVHASEPGFDVRVPAALGLSDSQEEFRDSPLGRAAPAAEWLALPVDARLALRLLYEQERGADSPWVHYIAMLPEHVPSARHMSDAELRATQSEYVQEEARLARQRVRELYERVARLAAAHSAPEACAFGAAEFGWAMDVVQSRSFTVDSGARGLQRHLVPFIDLLNYDGAPSCEFVYDEAADEFTVRALRPAQTGEALSVAAGLDYGEKTSEELLLYYGFVPAAPTPHDRLTLEGAYSAEDWEAAPGDAAMREEKGALLQSCRYAFPRSFELSGARIDPAIVCALRLLHLAPDELAGA